MNGMLILNGTPNDARPRPQRTTPAYVHGGSMPTEVRALPYSHWGCVVLLPRRRCGRVLPCLIAFTGPTTEQPCKPLQ